MNDASEKIGLNAEVLPPSPFAKYEGELNMGGVLVDVYVLDTEDRVLSQRGAVKALTGVDTGKLDEYLGAKGLQPFLAQAGEAAEKRRLKEPSTLILKKKTAGENQGVEGVNTLKNKQKTAGENCSFFVPGPGWAYGITAERFEGILTAYVAALNAGALTTDRQREIAMRCAVMSTAYLRAGLIAAIDEATGYQYIRASDALQIKIHAFISDEYREWQKLFPDQLWEQFGRLCRWNGALHSRPKWWGHLVNETIYDTLDPDVAKYLRENKPKPDSGVKYHQWLTGDFGAKALVTHIHQIIGIAKGCDSIREFREKVALAFTTGPAQITMWLPRGMR